MKKIIDGKLYDTDEAELIDVVEFVPTDAERQRRECLYRTENDNWFWHLSGGPASKYPMERIEPADPKDIVDEWLEAGKENLALEYFLDLIPRA